MSSNSIAGWAQNVIAKTRISFFPALKGWCGTKCRTFSGGIGSHQHWRPTNSGEINKIIISALMPLEDFGIPSWTVPAACALLWSLKPVRRMCTWEKVFSQHFQFWTLRTVDRWVLTITLSRRINPLSLTASRWKQHLTWHKQRDEVVQMQSTTPCLYKVCTMWNTFFSFHNVLHTKRQNSEVEKTRTFTVRSRPCAPCHVRPMVAV